jgi:pimeloyl-ACP methyl ester carboxylesterase
MMVLVVLLPVLLVSCGTYLLFHYEACNSTRPVPPPHGLADLARGVAMSFTGILLIVATAPLHFHLRRFGRRGAPSGLSLLPPVLLIHGSDLHAGVWVVLRRLLIRGGFTRVYCHAWRPSGRPLEEYGAEVDAALLAVDKVFPGERPLVVGHSMGGLMARIWLHGRRHPESRVAGMVTLGSPHRGSKTARMFGRRKDGLDESMAYGSAFFRDMEASETPAAIPCAALYSRMDNIIHPEDALVPPASAGWKVLETPPVSHMWLVLHPGICRMVLRELHLALSGGASDKPAGPCGAAVCPERIEDSAAS